MSSRVIVCSVEIYGHFLDPNWELVAERFERDYNSLILGSLVLPETERLVAERFERDYK